MKIIDCHTQLDKSLKLFTDIYTYNNKITDILMMRGKQITFKEVRDIFEWVYDMYKVIPYDFNSKYLEYFDRVDMDWLFGLKDDLVSLYNKIDGRLYINASINNFIKSINTIKLKTPIEGIYYILNHLTTTKYDMGCSLIVDDNLHREFIDQLYEACLKYRSAAIEYMNSLELPTTTDYEFEASKKLEWI